VEGGDGAEAAGVLAAAPGLDRVDSDVVPGGAPQQIAPGFRDAGEVGRRGLAIHGLQAPARGVLDNLRPEPLRVPDNDGVEVPCGFVGQKRRVIAAGHRDHAAPPKLAGDLVGALGIGGHEAHAHEVDVLVEVERFDVFVADADLVTLRRERGDCGEG
jgi:hypothetical protein